MGEEELEYDKRAEQPKEMTRREALAAVGKFAAFSAPVTLTLLIAEDASAWSPPDPPVVPPQLIPRG